MFNSLYPRVRALAEGPHAERALAAVAFAESSFFPIPPDVLLAPMALANPQRAWRYALIATIASVIGGMLGYAIGALLYNTVGQWLINLYGYGAKMDALKQTYAQWGWLVILVKGVTPIPYKLVTITSGLLGYNFPLVRRLVGRNARSAILSRRRRPALVRRTVAQCDGAQFRRGSRRIRRDGRRRLRDCDQGVLMTLAETALPPSQETRAVLIAAASIAILAAVWIFQGMGYAPCELCLTQRYAFYAAIPLALLTALSPAARRMVWRGPASRFCFGLCRQRRARRLPCRGRIPLVGGADRVHRRPRIPRRQRPGEGAGFGQGRALRRSPVADRRTVARRLECRGQRRAGGLCGARRAALGPNPIAAARPLWGSGP